MIDMAMIPVEYVVLLHDLGAELPFGGPLEDVLLSNHGASARGLNSLTSTFTQSRHRVTSLP